MSIIMCKNRKEVHDPNFWNNVHTGFVTDEYGDIDFTQPAEVYYARKFWGLYTPLSRRLSIENGEYSDPLTKEDIEFMINIATHEPDYFNGFNTVPMLCEILRYYDEIKDHGMILLFEGNY